ncbi:hypothetical protein G6M89_08525 [Natronolimnobius sp. AArcel1]|uniref:DUF7115 domain-containing protein n=1 Tax=Natronolimnobius sp. AArcel1 TaxID=1679093 RepID=UPI0013EB9155|nr:hypothetical protein [Natronolimnobius sp. AArcel1]NGM69055.1 hypothetical protein [Natronolimnobius sp. AArcel1]
MSVPGIVHSALDGEDVAARVSLGGEDELFITASSTLVYRSDGLLRDESVDEYPHDADRLTLSEGRRKTKFTLEYSLEGESEFTVPSGKTDTVLHPVLAGILNGNGITNPGETVVKTYRFSELTIIITSERLVKHIGSAVWDGDYEEYHYEDVTNLSFEDGSVATQVVLAVDGRPQRIKAPNDEANDLRERLQRALFEYHDVGSLEELNEEIGDDDAETPDEDTGSTMEFGSGVDPLEANPPELDDREPIGDGRSEPEPEPDPVREPTETTAVDSAAAEAPSSDAAVPESLEAQRTDHDESTTEPPASDDTADSHAQHAVSETAETEPAETGSFFDESEQSGSTWETTDTATESAETPATTTESSPRDDASSHQSAGREESAAASSATAGADAEDHDAQASPAVDDAVLERLDDLEATVEQQTELIEHQQETIEQLIEELRHGR